jgi:hypothetical protein
VGERSALGGAGERQAAGNEMSASGPLGAGAALESASPSLLEPLLLLLFIVPFESGRFDSRKMGFSALGLGVLDSGWFDRFGPSAEAEVCFSSGLGRLSASSPLAWIFLRGGFFFFRRAANGRGGNLPGRTVFFFSNRAGFWAAGSTLGDAASLTGRAVVVDFASGGLCGADGLSPLSFMEPGGGADDVSAISRKLPTL